MLNIFIHRYFRVFPQMGGTQNCYAKHEGRVPIAHLRFEVWSKRWFAPWGGKVDFLYTTKVRRISFLSCIK